MENFFAAKHWPKLDGRLHLYVLPTDEVADRFAAAQERLSDIEHLPLMPRAYLHCTLQGLGRHDDEVTQQDLTALGDSINAALAAVSRFTLSFDVPRVREAAVECPAAASPEWDALVAAVRDAVQSTWPGELPEPPHGPHLSLAYATGPANGQEATELLAGLEPIGPMEVATVHLVSVTMRPEVGIFDFTELANWDLA